MQDQAGDPTFPLWLIGDSEPTNWNSQLAIPLDPRHPARHNIWTSVDHYMQDEIFRRTRGRLDTSRIFIRNAVTHRKLKPGAEDVEWPNLQRHLKDLAADIATHQPEIVLSFGAFGFEFTRRAVGEKPIQPYNHWGTWHLGEEFRMRLASTARPLLLPLLHVSIARGQFLSGHRNFTSQEDGNYFQYVGKALAEVVLERLFNRDVWL